MTHVEIAKALFDAFTTGDDDAARALCAPDVQAIQNHQPPITLTQLLQFAAAVRGVATDYHYAEVVCTETPSGFVEEHSVRGTLPNGEQFRLPACVVGEVRDGLITQLQRRLHTLAAE